MLFGIEKLNVARLEIPAVTHADYSARIQTVHREINPLYYALIERFKHRTGCPVIVNTSFQRSRGADRVHIEDASCCFMGTEIDRDRRGELLSEKRGSRSGIATEL